MRSEEGALRFSKIRLISNNPKLSMQMISCRIVLIVGEGRSILELKYSYFYHNYLGYIRNDKNTPKKYVRQVARLIALSNLFQYDIFLHGIVCHV